MTFVAPSPSGPPARTAGAGRCESTSTERRASSGGRWSATRSSVSAGYGSAPHGHELGTSASGGLFLPLSCCVSNEPFDLGVVVARIRYEDDWRRRLGEALAAELLRPIRMRSRRGIV